jgi:excisionase family DNA binding protein
MTSHREELDDLTEVPRPRRLALKVRTAAELIDVAPSKMYELVSRKVVPSIRVDDSIRIPLEALINWVKQREKLGKEG